MKLASEIWESPAQKHTSQKVVKLFCHAFLCRLILGFLVGWCLNDIVFVNNNLAKWAKTEAAPDIPLLNKPLHPKIRKDPLGCVFIIGYASQQGTS